ncbi:hypothetical protein [Clavibacter capsici]|uniref:hypothetical protein n=1 Tax=Clavibacter capsici TaxID=1874630 RepID=UPI0014286440|nr:hypothetical protein [Clavibacter capsici]QIS38626.1 hypothetical protein GW572_04425 [Clavibacter capsici]
MTLVAVLTAIGLGQVIAWCIYWVYRMRTPFAVLLGRAAARRLMLGRLRGAGLMLNSLLISAASLIALSLTLEDPMTDLTTADYTEYAHNLRVAGQTVTADVIDTLVTGRSDRDRVFDAEAGMVTW